MSDVRIALLMALFFVVAAVGFAQRPEADRDRLEALMGRLKAIPAHNGSFRNVATIAIKASALNPIECVWYYRMARKKFNTQAALFDRGKLKTVISQVVYESDLPQNEKNRILKKLNSLPPPAEPVGIK